MPRDVFISYRSEDKVWADRLCEGLEKQNITCWLAPRDIPGGSEWAEAIVNALQQCKSFVLILSSNSSNARQISREAELADHQGLPIITFRVEDVQPPPSLLYFLGNLQWLDAFDDKFDSALKRLAEVVRSGGSAIPPAPTIPPAPVKRGIEPAPPSSIPSRNIAIGAAAVVVLALAAWFITGRKPNPAPVPVAGARVEAEKFLNDLKASNYDEAWDQFNATGRADHPKPRMEKAWKEADQKFGPLQSYRFNRCNQDDPSGIFTCQFKLEYSGGKTAEGTYVVARDSSGAWGISDSKHTEPKPAP